MDPAGLADLGLHLDWGNLDDSNTLDYACTIRGRDVRLKYAGFPYVLRGLRGTALVLPDRVELRDVTAEKGAMRMALSGTFPLDGMGKPAELALRATDLPLDAELLGALPAGVGLFGRLRPGGTCGLDLTRLRLGGANRPAGASPASSAAAAGAGSASAPSSRVWTPLEGLSDWLLEGELSLKDAEANLGTPAKITGSLVGRIEQQSGGLAIDANLYLASLSIQDRVMTVMRGRMRKDAAGSLIRIDDILGKAYGGRLEGFAEIRLGDPMKYGFRVVAEKMNLSEVFNVAAGEPNQRAAVEGLLDATIELRATEGNLPSRQVSGLLRLSKARFQKVPVLVNLLEPVLLAVPGESYSEGVVEYTLRQDKVLFREIHLRGQGLSLVGSGSMDLKNDALKITFLSRPGGLPRMDNLADELLDVLLRDLSEIQVTGTLKNPRFRTLPLRSITDIVKRLTRPEAE
jgi:hypothetical protein